MSKRLAMAAALALTLAPLAAQAGGGQCGQSAGTAPDNPLTGQSTPAPRDTPTLATPTLATVTVPQLALMLKNHTATPIDANTDKTRAAEGLIPGARVLSSATQYDVAKELPAQKSATLVFYCANTRCTASHDAAMRAMAAGYTSVKILPEGIMGWKSAGEKVAKSPNRS